MSSPLSLIPAAKLQAVENAILQVFNTTDIDELTLMTSGLSTSLVYKLVNNGHAYAMKVIVHSDAAHLFRCTQNAANAGIAPPVLYTNIEDGILITGFIEHTSLRAGYSSAHLLLMELARTIKAIHTTPIIAKTERLFDKIDAIANEFRESGILPKIVIDEVASYYAEIRNHYPYSDTDLVFSHNDLNPGNIIFDGKKIWVIDWDAAFMNDRYVDLAIVANSFVGNEAQEVAFLTAYFGYAPCDSESARFFLMRQVCYLLHAMIMFKLAMAMEATSTTHDIDTETPGLAEIGRRLGDGSLKISSYEGQLLYAKALLNEAMINKRSPRFASTISIVSR